MRRTNQVLGGRIRTPQDESDLLMTNQDPGKQITASQNESGSHRTNHGLPWWTKDLKPHFCCFPFYIFLLFVLDFGPLPKNSGSNPRTFQFWGYHSLGHFAKLASPKTDGWIRQCLSIYCVDIFHFLCPVVISLTLARTGGVGAPPPLRFFADRPMYDVIRGTTSGDFTNKYVFYRTLTWRHWCKW